MEAIGYSSNNATVLITVAGRTTTPIKEVNDAPNSAMIAAVVKKVTPLTKVPRIPVHGSTSFLGITVTSAMTTSVVTSLSTMFGICPIGKVVVKAVMIP